MCLNKIPTFLLCFLCAGCTVGPTYKQPKLATPAPDAWYVATTNNFVTGAIDVGDWWHRFDDPQLVSLISEAQQSNLSLKITTSNLLQARAAYGVAASEYSPNITAGGHVQREQASNNSPALASLPGISAPAVNDFTIGLDASWEIDLWGGIAKNVEAASAMFDAELEQYRDVLITVRAEVASSYINICVLQQKKILVNAYIETLQELLDLVEEQYKQGVITRIELEQERSFYDQGTTLLPQIEVLLSQEYARLSVLLGISYQQVVDKVTVRVSVPCASPDIAVGIPSDLIRRRPDIRAAERLLAARTALVGAVTSNLYPKLSLSGAFGYEATESNDLIRWSSRSYSFGPSVSWDIFNGDRIKSQIQIQEEKTSEAYLNWELTVLKAFSEVETSMLSLIEAGKTQDMLSDSAQSLLVAMLLTQEMVEDGVQNKLALLSAKQQLISAQLSLAEQTGAVSQNLISLYKALGGDWETDQGPDVKPIKLVRNAK